MWEGDISTTSQSALDHCSPKLFPNIRFYILIIVCTMPGTTCECERTFSSLKRLKTYTRSTITQDRLSGLALMHIHQSKELDLEAMFNIFSRKYPLCLKLVNVLDFNYTDL